MDQKTYDAIELGKEVDALISSKLGKYLIKKAETDRKKAMFEFGEANPTDVEKIAKIQADYNTPNKVMKWLLSAKEEGKAMQLEEEAKEELRSQNRTGNIR